MITEKEFQRLLDKTTFKRYKNVNDAWTLAALYPVNLTDTNNVHGYSACGMPNESWAKAKNYVTERIYKGLAEIWGFYGDITPFMKY